MVLGVMWSTHDKRFGIKQTVLWIDTETCAIGGIMVANEAAGASIWELHAKQQMSVFIATNTIDWHHSQDAKENGSGPAMKLFWIFLKHKKMNTYLFSIK